LTLVNTGPDDSLPGERICSTWFITSVFCSDEKITVLQNAQHFTCHHSMHFFGVYCNALALAFASGGLF